MLEDVECIGEDDEEFSQGKRQFCELSLNFEGAGASIRLGGGSKRVLGRRAVKGRKGKGKEYCDNLLVEVLVLLGIDFNNNADGFGGCPNPTTQQHEAYGMEMLGFKISLDSEGAEGEYL
ncbi:hypothetical protein GOBAR_DD06584 [Gossypium barbadense]|nr:hypothetical protein GOBAR_DD06584 [Gossypium barbadense]